LIFLFFLVSQASAQIQLEKYDFGEGFNLTDEDGFDMRIGGYIQPSLEMKQSSNSDEYFNRFRMRRARLRISGSPHDKRFSYRLQLDLSGSPEGDADENANNVLLDAFVQYQLFKNISITVGQKGTPTDNLELGMNSQTLQLPERSRLTSAFSSIRDFGFFSDASFKIRGTGMYIRPSVALTTGDGMNMFAKNVGGYKYGARIDFLPFGLFRSLGQFRQADMIRELTPKLLVGVNYSYNEGISDRRGRETGSIRYLDSEGNEVLPDYEKYGVDLLLKYQGFSLLGEYVHANGHVSPRIAQRVRNNGTSTDNFEIDGEQHVENYVKNRMMLGQGFNLQAGYLLKNLWSVDARYTHLIPQQYSFLHNGAYYARPDYYELGIAKYLTRNYAAKIQASVTYVTARDDARDNFDQQIQGHEWIGRLLFTIGF